MLATNIWTDLASQHKTIDLEPCSNCRTPAYDSTVVEGNYNSPTIHLRCEDCGQVDEFTIIQLVQDTHGNWIRPVV